MAEIPRVNLATLLKSESFFRVLLHGHHSQVALLSLRPGEGTGNPASSDHPQADQVIYVLAGTGAATVSDTTISLAPGDVLIIPAGAPHELRCTGSTPLHTLTVYAPPAY